MSLLPGATCGNSWHVKSGEASGDGGAPSLPPTVLMNEPYERSRRNSRSGARLLDRGKEKLTEAGNCRRTAFRARMSTCGRDRSRARGPTITIDHGGEAPPGLAGKGAWQYQCREPEVRTPLPHVRLRTSGSKRHWNHRV